MIADVLAERYASEQMKNIWSAEGKILLEGNANEIAEKIEEITGSESKAVILSYIQRGGSPTSNDRILATRTACKAVELIRDGFDSRAVGVEGGEITHYPLADALKMTKPFKQEMLDMAIAIS